MAQCGRFPTLERRARLARAARAGARPRASTRPRPPTRAMTVLHATEPATVYLSCCARVDDLTVADVDRALYATGAWSSSSPCGAPSSSSPATCCRPPGGAPRHGSPGRARADGQGRREGRVWPPTATPGSTRLAREVLGVLDDQPDGLRRDARSASRARRRGQGDGLRRVGLGLLAGCSPTSAPPPTSCAAANTGHWRTSRPRWTLIAALARRGPGAAATRPTGYRRDRAPLAARPSDRAPRTTWSGGSARPRRVVRSALAELGGGRGRPSTAAAPAGCCPTTSSRSPTPEPWVALLPVLDPTVMGWKERDFYLGAHARGSSSTATATPARPPGSTAGWSGCWVQDDDGVVDCGCSRRCRAAAGRALEVEAERLTAWLDGHRVGTVYPSMAMKGSRTHGGLADAMSRQPPEQQPPPGAAAADPLRQARPAPVHQPPRLQPGLRAGGLPRPGPDGLLVGLQPAPAHLLRRRGPHRVGQRGGVPRDRARPGRRPG